MTNEATPWNFGKIFSWGYKNRKEARVLKGLNTNAYLFKGFNVVPGNSGHEVFIEIIDKKLFDSSGLGGLI